MKKIVYFMMAAAIALVSCKKTEDKINDVQVSLTKGGEAFAVENVEVSLRSSANATVYTALTDANGVAVFQMKAGAYEASATLYQNSDIYNGTNSAVIVADGAENAFKLDMVASKTSQVIIKELYFGGCTDDAGKHFQYDKYVILYNNSPVEADASKYAFGMLCPTNSNMASKWMKDGKLSYTDYMPMWAACWWFQTAVKIPAYSQIVVAINGAVNHSATVSNSVDLSHADYAMYDPEVFNNAKSYPAPDASIPTDHYLKTYLYGLGNAWPLSIMSPAFVVFAPEGTTTEAFVTNPDNIETPGFLTQYTGVKNLEILADMKRMISKADIRLVLKKVGLDPDMKKPVGKYSLGMRQRLGIAQAIMEDPRFLILDEPFNGLDKHGVAEIRELLLDLKAAGKTILLASHNDEDIRILCDHVYEMDGGVLRERTA